MIWIIYLPQLTLIIVITFFFHFHLIFISKTYCHLQKRRRTSAGDLVYVKYDILLMESYHVFFHFIVQFNHGCSFF